MSTTRNDNQPARSSLGLSLLVGTGALVAVMLARRARKVRAVAPDLRRPALWIQVPTTRMLLPALRWNVKASVNQQAPAGATASERHVPGPPGAPDVRVMTYERVKRAHGGPALLWIHGGGYVLGTPEMDVPIFSRMLDRLDLAIVAVDYRLAPEHPFPTPLDDCYAVWRWMVEQAEELGIDPSRIAIAGASAGGGLAAALVQRVADQGPAAPAFQILVYPMLDNSTGVVDRNDGRGQLSWTPSDNRRGWAAYLAHDADVPDDRVYAVPARRENLGGLPATWVGVGSLDLFHDEDVAYARRLSAAGVECALEIVDGGYHGFDVFAADAPTSVDFHRSMIDALAVAVERS